MTAQSPDNFHVEFSAQITELSKGIREAAQKITALERSTEKSTANISGQFERAGSAIGVALKAGIATAAIAAAKQVASLNGEIAGLARSADAAGVTTTDFQRLRAAFIDAGLGADKTEQTLVKFNSVLGELRAKSGDAFQFLRQQVPTLYAQMAATNSTAEAFNVAVDAISRMDTAENKALLTKKLFGDEAIKLVRVLGQGSDAFRKAGDEAEQLGRVLDEKGIRKAEELERAYQSATDRIGMMFKRLVVGVASVFDDVGGTTTKNIKTLAEAVEVLDRNYKENLKLLPGVKAGLDPLAESYDNIAKAAMRAAEASASAAPKLNAWKTETTPSMSVDKKPDFRGIDQINQLRSSLAQSRGQVFEAIRLEQQSSLESVRRLYADLGMSEAQYQEARALIGQRANAQILEARRQFSDQIKQLEVGAMEARKETLDAIRATHDLELENYRRMVEQKVITEDQFARAREAIAAKASAQVTEYMKEEVAKQREHFAALENVMTSALADPFAVADQGAKQFFANFAKDISRAIYQMTIMKPLVDGLFGNKTSAGLLTSALSSLPGVGGVFAPQRAEGGAVRAGGIYQINERAGRKPEVFVPQVAGRVVPGERAASAATYGGGSNSVVNIDARYSDAGVYERVVAAIAAMERSKPTPVAAIDAFSRRYPTRRIA